MSITRRQTEYQEVEFAPPSLLALTTVGKHAWHSYVSMTLLRDKVPLQRWWSFSLTSGVSGDKWHAVVTHLHYLNERMAPPCGGSTKPRGPAELNGSREVFSITAAATSASTGKVLVATPFVTSCSIRPFVKTFPCIWGWLSGWILQNC